MNHRPAEEFLFREENAKPRVSAKLALRVRAITEDRQASRRSPGKLLKGTI